MSESLGLMLIGCGGAIGSTVIAGVEAMRRNLAAPLGMLTETGRMPGPGYSSQAQRPLIRDTLNLAKLDQIHLGGWDLRADTMFTASQREQIVPEKLVSKLEEPLSQLRPFGGIVSRGSDIRRVGQGETHFNSLRQAADAIRGDIQAFRKANNVGRVVLVDLTPTRPAVAPSAAHKSIKEFEAALEGTDPSITSNMLYMYAALKEGCPFINFTPNVVEVDALKELAEQARVGYAGRDGKTGQTYLKTVLAPAFRERQLHVRGWYSANILGNEDGKALSNPNACETKIISKASVLESILGYPVVAENGENSHVVSILYYPPRGDEKEAWDSIDLEGFLGQRLQLKINFLCKDSILAAPLVIDLARMAAWGHQHGDAGSLDYLSLYFKSPHPTATEGIVHDFFHQVDMFARRVTRNNRAS
jgi:myo-inositol-1-phosphate synthase